MLGVKQRFFAKEGKNNLKISQKGSKKL